MKKLLLTLALCMGYLCTTVAQTFVKTEVKQSMRRVADWQIAHYNKAIYGDLNWVNATFYLGLVHWAAIAEQADKDDLPASNCGSPAATAICSVSRRCICICMKSTKEKVCLSRHRHVPNG